MHVQSVFVVMEVVTLTTDSFDAPVISRVFRLFCRNTDAEFDTRLEAERAILGYLEGLHSPSDSPTLFIRELYRLVWE